MNTTTPADLRAKAEASRQASRDSWERSDTDGALSQWASDTTALLYDRQADLLEQGNVAQFPALFDSKGRRLQARLIDGDFGLAWAVTTTTGRTLWIPHTLTWDEERDEDGRGTFTNPRFGPRTKAAKHGLRFGYEEASAKVVMTGSGRGLGSLHTVRPITVRTDRGYPDGAVPYDG